MLEHARLKDAGRVGLLTLLVQSSSHVLVDMCWFKFVYSHIAEDFTQIDQGSDVATLSGGGLCRNHFNRVPLEQVPNVGSGVFRSPNTFRPLGRCVSKSRPEPVLLMTIP